MASNARDLMFFAVRAGKPVRQRRIMKKIPAEKNLKKMRQKGVKLWRAILVATNESPQKRTAVAKARYVRIELWVFIGFSHLGVVL